MWPYLCRITAPWDRFNLDCWDKCPVQLFQGKCSSKGTRATMASLLAKVVEDKEDFMNFLYLWHIFRLGEKPGSQWKRMLWNTDKYVSDIPTLFLSLNNLTIFHLYNCPIHLYWTVVRSQALGIQSFFSRSSYCAWKKITCSSITGTVIQIYVTQRWN